MAHGKHHKKRSSVLSTGRKKHDENKGTQSKREKKQNSAEPSSRRTWLIPIIVSVLAISIQYRWSYKGDKDPVISFISSFVCDHPEGYCDAALRPRGRTHFARRNIPAKTTLVKIPRALQIWDLDALRHLPAEYATARHGATGKPLDGGAFLAVYLWRRFVKEPLPDDRLLPYYNVLPSLEALRQHPLLWSSEELQTLLSPYSQAYTVVRGYRDMVGSEYRALSKFTHDLSRMDYLRFRILVLSRSFGTGPPTDDEKLPNKTLQEELQHYRKEWGVDISPGCRAMVPLLDLYNHHPTPNVRWRYHDRVFQVASAHDILAGEEIYDSYGTYTEAHLLAKFGFLNGDGSAPTEGSMAAMHRVMDAGMRQQFSYLPSSSEKYRELMEDQKMLLMRYLQFDDGSEECITSLESPEYELKQLKLQNLMRLANDYKRWVVTVPARRPNANPHDSPPRSTPSFDLQRLPEFDGGMVLSTCRLLVLSTTDYDGKAIEVLRKHLEKNDSAIIVEKQSDDLQHRALLCLRRWTSISLHHMSNQTTNANADRHSKEWMAQQVILGELQTLEILNQVAASGAHGYAEKLSSSPSVVRYNPCDLAHTTELATRTRFV